MPSNLTLALNVVEEVEIMTPCQNWQLVDLVFCTEKFYDGDLTDVEFLINVKSLGFHPDSVWRIVQKNL